MAGLERRRQSADHGEEHGNNLSKIRGQQKDDGFSDIFIDAAALFDCAPDCRKIVVRQNHVCRLSRHIRTIPSHGNANVGSL